MAQKAQKKVATPADKAITAVFVIVVVAVLALAVFATYPKISEIINAKKVEEENTAIANGEQEANYRYLLENSGLSAEEYLAQYGLTTDDGIEDDTTLSEMMSMMTIENYYKYLNDYYGYSEGDEGAYDVDELLTEWSAADYGITKDTIWSDFETTIPVANYVGGEDAFNETMESYTSQGYDVSSITSDMSLKDAEDALDEITSKDPTLPVASDETETSDEISSDDTTSDDTSAEETTADAE